MVAASASSLRILHIASWYPSAVHGTLGNFVERHVQAISNLQGGEVWFAAAVPAGEVVPANTVRDCGTYTERIFYFRARKPMVRQVTRALLRAAKELSDFDLIHLHVAYPAGRAARKLARKWGIPLVLTEHWTAYHANQRSSIPFWGKWSMRLTGQMARMLCPVSDDLARSMRSFGMLGKYTVVPNVVDTQLFHPEPKRPQTTTFHALHISSLHDEQKNVSGLLRSAAIALEFCSNLRVAIIGDGDPKPYKVQARKLGIDDAVEISGEIPLEEVAERMRHSDALLLFSRYENFPCVIPEAWASGIPVLSTDVGGIREYLTDERGTLIPSEDESALAQTLIQWAQHPDQFNAQSMREYAESMFSVDAVAQAYDDVYREAITGQTTAR
ncbi:MAG: glycosyltransferase [Flavobacteriales bacterium]